MKHLTSEKGDIGELIIAADLIKKGCNVFTPVSSTSPFDLLVLKDNKYFRIQVKYRTINKKGSLDVSKTRNTISNNNIKEVENTYVDIMAIYCPCNNNCYYIKTSDFKTHLSIRIEESKNNQKQGIRYAKDYLEFPI